MIEIKEITKESDVSLIVKSIAEASWSENSEINPEDYSVDNLSRCAANELQIFCVAFYEGEFAGMASAFLLQKPSGDTMLYIDEIDVCSDKQQKGIGTELMKFLFDYGRSHKCDDMWLGTEKDNVAANALYNSLKPLEVEEFVGYTFR